MRLRTACTCVQCDQEVPVGALVFPVEDASSGRMRWHHMECIQQLHGGALPPMPVRKGSLSTGLLIPIS